MSPPDRQDDKLPQQNSPSRPSYGNSHTDKTTNGVASTAEASSPQQDLTLKPRPVKELCATKAMCHHCFDVLIDALQNPTKTSNGGNLKRPSLSKPPPFALDLVDVSVECPLFVTWDKQQPQRRKTDIVPNWQLRGCIGTLSPRLLVTALGEYALISALKDRRFSPIKRPELTSLRVSVSLLTNYEDCKDVFDWTVGVHGITIHFRAIHPSTNRVHDYNATYLPEVAKEQGWDRQKTVLSLIQKAGYNGVVNDALLQSIRCTRYQSSKHRVTFGEYMAESSSDYMLDPQQQSPGTTRQWNSCNNL